MVDLEAFRLPVELTEEEWVRLQQLIVADMVEETRRQPPQTEFYGFTPSSRHEAAQGARSRDHAPITLEVICELRH